MLFCGGKKAHVHNEVFEKTNKEITSFISNDQVSKGRKFYMKLVDSMVNVHLRQICTLADQPERRELTSINAGNGVFTGQWGYSGNLYAIWAVIVPCVKCREKMFEELNTEPFKRTWDAEVCTECTRWEIDVESPLLEVPADEKKYPKDCFSTGKIEPFR